MEEGEEQQVETSHYPLPPSALENLLLPLPLQPATDFSPRLPARPHQAEEAIVNPVELHHPPLLEGLGARIMLTLQQAIQRAGEVSAGRMHQD